MAELERDEADLAAKLEEANGRRDKAMQTVAAAKESSDSAQTSIIEVFELCYLRSSFC